MNQNTNLAATLDALKKAQASPYTPDSIAKAITVATGLVAYDLQAPAIALYPWGQMITPLRVALPRVGGGGDTATRWKAITGIDTAQQALGVSEGNRGGLISTTVANVTAAYAGLGMEDSVTFEADYAAMTFDDARARGVEGLLRAFMIAEEKMLFGGNSSVVLGTTPTPSLVAGTAGSMATQAAASVICVALTFDGFQRATLASGVVQTIVRTNADATSDTINAGAAQKSANATVSVTGPTGSIAASVTAVRGAMAYAWYVGTAAGSERIAAITTINSVVLTSYPGAGQLASALVATDYSAAGVYAFDGLMYSTAFKSTSGAYFATQATGTAGTGTPLTTDSAGGIVEIDAALKAFYDLYRLSPDTIWASTQEIVNISKKVVAGGGAPLFRFVMDSQNGGDRMNIIAGAVVGQYLNKFTQQLVKVRVHPNAIAGTLFFSSASIPYPLSGVGNVAQVKTRREIYQLEWPLRTRKYEFGIYADEVLQVYALFAFGAITNIGNG